METKNVMSEDNVDKLRHMNDDIIRTLECPTCMITMEAPIYVCMTGHSICNDCWTTLTNCPLCNEELAATRNYTLESVASFVCLPCENADYGCNKILNIDDFTAHTKICRFKTYECKISPETCDFEGRLTELEEHVYQAHPLHATQGDSNFFVWRSDQQPNTYTQMVVIQKTLFYVHRISKNDNMYWVVQYLGNFKEEDVEYSYTVRMKKGTKSQNRFFIMNDKCVDNTLDDIEEIIGSGHCVVVPLTTLDTYKVQHILRYQVQIKLSS